MEFDEQLMEKKSLLNLARRWDQRKNSFDQLPEQVSSFLAVAGRASSRLRYFQGEWADPIVLYDGDFLWN